MPWLISKRLSPAATPGPLASLEQTTPAAAPPGKLPEVNSPGQIEAAQQQLARLGCFSGAADGSLDAATRAAIQVYQKALGQNPTNDAEITDDYIVELKQQSANVCPVVCPAGKIAEGRQCVDAGKSRVVVPPKDEDKQGKASKPSVTKQEARPAPTPRSAQQAPSGGSRSPVTPGVGF